MRPRNSRSWSRHRIGGDHHVKVLGDSVVDEIIKLLFAYSSEWLIEAVVLHEFNRARDLAGVGNLRTHRRPHARGRRLGGTRYADEPSYRWIPDTHANTVLDNPRDEAYDAIRAAARAAHSPGHQRP